jgi:hypothetical protein
VNLKVNTNQYNQYTKIGIAQLFIKEPDSMEASQGHRSSVSDTAQGRIRISNKLPFTCHLSVTAPTLQRPLVLMQTEGNVPLERRGVLRHVYIPTRCESIEIQTLRICVYSRVNTDQYNPFALQTRQTCPELWKSRRFNIDQSF